MMIGVGDGMVVAEGTGIVVGEGGSVGRGVLVGTRVIVAGMVMASAGDGENAVGAVATPMPFPVERPKKKTPMERSTITSVISKGFVVFGVLLSWDTGSAPFYIRD